MRVTCTQCPKLRTTSGMKLENYDSIYESYGPDFSGSNQGGRGPPQGPDMEIRLTLFKCRSAYMISLTGHGIMSSRYCSPSRLACWLAARRLRSISVTQSAEPAAVVIKKSME